MYFTNICFHLISFTQNDSFSLRPLLVKLLTFFSRMLQCSTCIFLWLFILSPATSQFIHVLTLEISPKPYWWFGRDKLPKTSQLSDLLLKLCSSHLLNYIQMPGMLSSRNRKCLADYKLEVFVKWHQKKHQKICRKWYSLLMTGLQMHNAKDIQKWSTE